MAKAQDAKKTEKKKPQKTAKEKKLEELKNIYRSSREEMKGLEKLKIISLGNEDKPYKIQF